MTGKIRLSYGKENISTSISNTFIDNYMADAHGSYVKVYIYLVRCLLDPSMSVSIANISDKLEETENDIVKALKYWAKKNVLSLEFYPDGRICSISIPELSTGSLHTVRSESEKHSEVTGYTIYPNDPRFRSVPSDAYLPDTYDIISTDITPMQRPKTPEPEVSGTASADDPSQMPRPNYTSGQMEQFREFDEFNSLIDYIEEHLGKTLTHRDLQTPAFLFESLEFSPDLIRYLYDYCIGLGKKSSAYIEKVARNWVKEGINTVEKAQSSVLERSAELAAVRKAFGISRAFGSAELEYVSKWSSVYRMNPALITEACNRTILTVGKPAFEYTDRILSSWNDSGITTFDELRILDQAHEAKSHAKRQAPKTPNTGNKFSQFPQRSYSQADFDEIERRKLGLS